jgi:YesN/AraC family two-component response regulator
VERIRQAVAQGVSFARVAARFHVPIALIRKEASAIRRRRIQERNAAIRAQYRLHRSFDSIAKQFALSPVQVGRICKQAAC